MPYGRPDCITRNDTAASMIMKSVQSHQKVNKDLKCVGQISYKPKFLESMHINYEGNLPDLMALDIMPMGQIIIYSKQKG